MKRGKYSVVYADPPWMYNARRHANTRFGQGSYGQFPMMETKDICSLPVEGLVADSAVLLLWATWPRLPDALAVIDAWGFDYKTLGFIWVKLNKRRAKKHLGMAYAESAQEDVVGFLEWLRVFGLGNYAKSNTEPCLLAVRGRIDVLDHSISQVVFASRGKYAAKPPEVRERIERLFGNVPRVELFARGRTPGWDCHGNEIEDPDVHL